MAVLNHDEQIKHWQHVLACRGEDRRGLVAGLGALALGEAAKVVDLYRDENDICAETFLVIDQAGYLANLLEPFTRGGEPIVVAEDAISSVVSTLHDAATRLEGTDRTRATELSDYWRKSVYDRLDREPEWLKVAEVASIYGLTAQAVYKWIHAGHVEAEQTPGGSYRVRSSSLKTSREDEQRVDRLRIKLRKRASAESEEKIMDRAVRVRHRKVK